MGMAWGGRRILVVEDDSFNARFMAAAVAEVGATFVGPVVSEQDALDVLAYDDRPIEGAILDLRIGGSSTAVAMRLRELGVPFIFATGEPSLVPPGFRDQLVCHKPFTPAHMFETLARAFEEAVGVNATLARDLPRVGRASA